MKTVLSQIFMIGCQQHPGSAQRPCARPFTVTDIDSEAGSQFFKMSTRPPAMATDLDSESMSQFYTMSETGEEEFPQLSSQERVAR